MGGPYDFGESSISQKVYYENCKLDAVQQMCSAIYHYLIQLAKEYPLAAGQLKSAAEIVGSAKKQTECVLALYEAGEFDGMGNPIAGKRYDEISDTSWNISVGNSALTIYVELLEVLELDYPEPPAQCRSIFENDHDFLPLLTEKQGGGLDVLELDSGGATLSNNIGFLDNINLPEGYASIAKLRSGEFELRHFLLRDPFSVTVVVDSVPYDFDTWSISLVSPVSEVTLGNMANFAAGEAVFALSVVYGGALHHVAGTNASTFTVEAKSGGSWEVDGLELTFDDGGVTWTLTFGSLSFVP